MIKLVVKVICVEPGSEGEVCLYSIEHESYDLQQLNADIRLALASATKIKAESSTFALKESKPQVAIALTVIDESVRPSFHLEDTTIRDLASVGASVDFDPYV